MMRFKVIYNPEVYNDIRQAVDWYNKQQPELGLRFISVLKKHLRKLEHSAMHYSVRYGDIRCMPIKRFPYMIHYRVQNKTVLVEAIFNTYRDSGLWEKRTGKF